MIKLKLTVLALAMMASVSPSYSESGNKSLSVDDLVEWKRITQRSISNDGKWVACNMEPWKGNTTVYLYDHKGKEVVSFPCAGSFNFSASSQYLLVDQKPDLKVVENLKLKKTKKEDMPMNALMIYKMSGDYEKIDSLKGYKLSAHADWVAYQSGRKDSTLYVRTLDGKKVQMFPHVTDYGFAEKGDMLYYVEKADGVNRLSLVDLQSSNSVLVKEGKGIFSKITFSEQGHKLAFLYADDEKTAYKGTELWLSEQNAPARRIVAAGHPSLADGWVVSQFSSLAFSKSALRLFFGTSPEPRQKDTLQLEEHRPNVQVWSWDEPVQYTVQQFNKEKDLKKNFEAVYNIAQSTVCQLATLEQPDLMIAGEGDAPLAVAYTSRPYSRSRMWEGRTRNDYYTVSLATGQRKQIARADYGEYELSPKGKYAYWYAETDSCWYTLSLADGQKRRLTSPDTFVGWDEDNDVPDFPKAHGCAGWADDDRYVYIYDRYDIWRFDPQGEAQAVNMTVNGRQNQVAYRLKVLDEEQRTVSEKEIQILQGTDEKSKGDAYYSFRFAKPAHPKFLLGGHYRLDNLVKAKDSDQLIFTKETFEVYPDIHYTNMKFKQPLQLTEGYRQQEGFRWGTAELVSWTSLDGRQLEGVIYKPADFDPAKKYPLMVNFYERNSETLYKYRMPETHRSTIDYHMYNSNNYIIFNPDVRYTDGHPGKSCYKCVVPGVEMVVKQGYIDEKAIGAQGHSWGGYQTAYLVTRTSMFAAIESGAPVVNMFSAYGGIRWGSGLARSFQYEHTQSRLGATPWNGYDVYRENSPLFTMDKVQTPVLIMHNDCDGHVPWYQGIEYFVAMKRLNKPCWLLNYTGEIHWPMKLSNRIDFQKRMLQFFNHYLKGEPMPQWMSEGLPAVDQPFELGY